ncbi:hypothetical protein FSARC_12968 [Fusarium sarcochroum]|uniref:AB hydrolase-1 domain-containing protein n=1 Tax=Fusarium sarcochroum TaxID=1208366 RepID=A0A8H4T4R9_9HYPO|nr:hypothetical protein FSARC_12968 [Fusarium sarcochroum]
MTHENFGLYPQRALRAPKSFFCNVADEELTRLHTLVKASPIGPLTYENGVKQGPLLTSIGCLIELVVSRYKPETLLFHLIVPSLPGYAFSDGPPLDRDFGLKDAARVMDKLMVELGFGSGYLAQGGDVGSMIAMLLSANFETCKALHVTYLAHDPADLPGSLVDVTEEEKQHLERAKEWRKTGMGYALEQSTRPATIGLALSANPLALLAWVGEKFIEWSDKPIPLDTILGIVSLYWLTDSYPRTIWSYRSIAREGLHGLATSEEKPLGYAVFNHELSIVPQAWAKRLYPNMLVYHKYKTGGHFPGLENPTALLESIMDFVSQVAPAFND